MLISRSGCSRKQIINAFTLVEVLVVLGVVSVMIGIAAFAISQSQGIARSEDRLNMASKISSGVNDYLRENGRLPSEENGTFNWSTTKVTIGDTIIELEGNLRYSSDATGVDSTKYVYARDFGSYQICVQQESGNWEGVGSGKNLCPE